MTASGLGRIPDCSEVPDPPPNFSTDRWGGGPQRDPAPTAPPMTTGSERLTNDCSGKGASSKGAGIAFCQNTFLTHFGPKTAVFKVFRAFSRAQNGSPRDCDGGAPPQRLSVVPRGPKRLPVSLMAW